MDREFFNTHTFTKQALIDNVFTPNGNDGIRVNSDVQRLVHEDRARQLAKKFFLLSIFGTGFSAYNVTRLRQLSPTGRPAAIGGLIFFSLMIWRTAKRANFGSK